MKTVVFSNQKGGVGKTTSAAALAAGLSGRGYRVIAADVDPQCNLCLSSGVDMLTVSKTLFDVFKGTAAVDDVIVPGLGFDIMPGGLTLAAADMDFTQAGREYMLSEALEAVSERYDYAIVDTPPTLGILTTNALTAADGVIVPLTADVYALQGLSQLNGLIRNVRKYCNRELKIYGLLLTKFNERQNVSKVLRDQVEAAAAQLETKVFKTTIRESVAVREAQLLHSDFLKEAPNANATLDYESFIAEFLESEG
jgi:chromosome partitioning protein